MNPRALVAVALAAALVGGCALENPALQILPDAYALDAGNLPDAPDAPDAPEVAADPDAPARPDVPDAPAAFDVADVPDAPDGMDAVTDLGPAPCAGDADCRGDAAGPVCDVASGRCVRCLPSRDACPAGEYCVAATRACAPGCRDDDACAGAGDAGAGSASRCDPEAHRCVACLVDEHCPVGALCVGRACVPGCNATRTCPTGRACCGGACVDPATDAAHCGACGRACSLPGATAACRGGACAVAACVAPAADCNGAAADGCEVDLRTSPANCGACGRTAVEVCDGADNDCDGLVDEGFSATGCVSLACTGSGVIHTVGNTCLDDYGATGGSDTLQVYCVAGVARFCLSGEACPWRAGGATSAAVTCSRAGLATDAMGRATCERWNSRSNYSCDAMGRVYFP